VRKETRFAHTLTDLAFAAVAFGLAQMLSPFAAVTLGSLVFAVTFGTVQIRAALGENGGLVPWGWSLVVTTLFGLGPPALLYGVADLTTLQEWVAVICLMVGFATVPVSVRVDRNRRSLAIAARPLAPTAEQAALAVRPLALVMSVDLDEEVRQAKEYRQAAQKRALGSDEVVGTTNGAS